MMTPFCAIPLKHNGRSNQDLSNKLSFVPASLWSPYDGVMPLVKGILLSHKDPPQRDM